jgi:zinc protease
MSRRLVLTLLAAPAALAAQQFPATPPAPAPLVTAALPTAQEALLPNGLRLVVLPRPRQPIVSLTLLIPAGSAFDPPDREGMADLMAGLLTRGAGDRSAQELERDVDGMGGSLSAVADPDFVTVRADVTTQHAATAFSLVGDMVLRPVFTDAELGAMKRRTVDALDARLREPAGLAARIFLLAAYRRHPYARRPTPQSVAAITRDEVLAFHAARVRPAGSTLVVAGDITLAEARRLAMAALGSWKGVRPA